MVNKKHIKISLLTMGRFHLLDLARELNKYNFKIKFFSCLNLRRIELFGLTKDSIINMFLPLILFSIWEFKFTKFFLNFRQILLTKYINKLAIIFNSNPNICIFMSGLFLEAPIYFKKKFGSYLIIERGSKHIMAQNKLMKNISQYMIDRELKGYEISDLISIPSYHVYESFMSENPKLKKKLFINPYGVELSNFPSIKKFDDINNPKLLFVGNWSKRKGADILTKIIKILTNFELIHVGPQGDYILPKFNNFKHVGKIDQNKLKHYYRKSHIFILCSYEEGLSTVLVQALASGLPIICSKNSGGIDLAHTKGLKDRIFEVKDNFPIPYIEKIKFVFDMIKNDKIKTLKNEDRQHLSWDMYGKRYYDKVKSIK